MFDKFDLSHLVTKNSCPRTVPNQGSQRGHQSRSLVQVAAALDLKRCSRDIPTLDTEKETTQSRELKREVQLTHWLQLQLKSYPIRGLTGGLILLIQSVSFSFLSAKVSSIQVPYEVSLCPMLRSNEVSQSPRQWMNPGIQLGLTKSAFPVIPISFLCDPAILDHLRSS